MKNQGLFISKDKSKKLKYRLLQFLFGALRVKGDNLNLGLLLVLNMRSKPMKPTQQGLVL